MLNYYLSQNFKLIQKNYLTNTLTTACVQKVTKYSKLS